MPLLPRERDISFDLIGTIFYLYHEFMAIHGITMKVSKNTIYKGIRELRTGDGPPKVMSAIKVVAERIF